MTKFEVTLKQLRQNKACVSGYNKVVSALIWFLVVNLILMVILD